MLVYLRDISAQTIIRAATLREKLRIKLATQLQHTIAWPNISALTTHRQTPGKVATGVPTFKSQFVCLLVA